MIRQNITIPKTARYFMLGGPSAAIEQVWIVCHGYAQLANYFLRHFEALQDARTLIVAPEGLHRFYREGFSGRVAASWMTKEDRLDDIADYIGFLNAVCAEVTAQLDLRKVKITVLGFSQGGATVMRWLSASQPQIHQLILWGSTLPAEIDYAADAAYFNSFPVRYVLGSRDEFIGPEEAEAQEALFRKNGLKVDRLGYEGGHGIGEKELQEVLQKMNE